MERDGVKLNAIYKNIDNVIETMAKLYIDSYKAEIVAWELDKLLDLQILPPIVERKVEGKKGR